MPAKWGDSGLFGYGFAVKMMEDTEGGFIPERALQIASGIVVPGRDKGAPTWKQMKLSAIGYFDLLEQNSLNYLDGITIIRILDYVEQVAAIQTLDTILCDDPRVSALPPAFTIFFPADTASCS